MSNATHGGKGDRPRPVDRSKYEHNWSKVFGKGKAPVASSDDMLEEDFVPGLTDVEIERKLKEWGMMYDCLQNIHLYEYPVEEARALLKQIKVS